MRSVLDAPLQRGMRVVPSSPSTVIRPFLPLRFLGRLLATVMSRSSSSYGRMTDLRCRLKKVVRPSNHEIWRWSPVCSLGLFEWQRMPKAQRQLLGVLSEEEIDGRAIPSFSY
mmetsp:Transcript_36289/g.90322  ORF Transcript_36289/g.90322 Transcript_36289/m.90322 type:complete len:113 (-) Transcript_36289:642-980(-)